ncbi:MAG: putative histidine kinase, atypical hybrid [Planctomycetaceae bacterium]|nr:putative histidine kinase, atypical hybrid [Planctomycetaceae bacterium]
MNSSRASTNGTTQQSQTPDWPAVVAPLSIANDAPINILIVDDEPKNLTVLETVLDDPGYRLVRAESADQALLALVGEEFALLILDVRMPGMTGFELAKMIKERKKTSRVPIIFLTAYYNEDQHVLVGYGTGAVDYLHKPVNQTILRSKVAVFAELYRKNRESTLANAALVAEVIERRRAEEQLRELTESLEQRVTERTETLRHTHQKLREQAAELSDLHRRKDEFLAMLSHELRSPLAPIANAVQLLGLERASETLIQQQARGIIERQLGQLRHLVDDLLEVSRVTSGRVQLRQETIAIGAIIERAVETVRPLIQQCRHHLKILLPPNPILLHADSARLEQVMVNLLTNAAKYSEPGGDIQIVVNVEWRQTSGELGTASGEQKASAHSAPFLTTSHAALVIPELAAPFVVIRVLDTGIGIAAPLLPRIFDLFTQAERSLDRSQGGLGVGLALVQRITELHGGRVEVYSTLGKGSEFIVCLPLLSEERHGIIDTSKDSTPPARGQFSPAAPLRVLVVDDNADTAFTLGMLLEASGNEVRTAHDGVAAFQATLEFRPDVAVLDIGLPGLSGYEVAKRIRQERDFQDIVLVALTGYGQEADRQTSLDAGFNYHLVKPARLDQLQEILATVSNKGE